MGWEIRAQHESDSPFKTSNKDQNKQQYCSECVGLACGNKETQYLWVRQNKKFFLAHKSSELCSAEALLLTDIGLSSSIGTKVGNSAWHPRVLLILPRSETCHFGHHFICQSKSHAHPNFRRGQGSTLLQRVQKVESQNCLMKISDVCKTTQQTNNSGSIL